MSLGCLLKLLLVLITHSSHHAWALARPHRQQEGQGGVRKDGRPRGATRNQRLIFILWNQPRCAGFHNHVCSFLPCRLWQSACCVQGSVKVWSTVPILRRWQRLLIAYPRSIFPLFPWSEPWYCLGLQCIKLKIFTFIISLWLDMGIWVSSGQWDGRRNMLAICGKSLHKGCPSLLDSFSLCLEHSHEGHSYSHLAAMR